jgi:hypothetical protein
VKHVAENTLALYAGRELGWWRRFRIARHLRSCDQCRRQAEEFLDLREFLSARQDEPPAGLDWDEAAAAMKANIRLGIAAGQCVEPLAASGAATRWRAPALALPVLAMIVVGWLLQSLAPPLPITTEQEPTAVLLSAGPAGIGVEQDGRGFRLLQPVAARDVEVSVRGDSIRSRYLDGETGQVTISHVYAE